MKTVLVALAAIALIASAFVSVVLTEGLLFGGFHFGEGYGIAINVALVVSVVSSAFLQTER